MTYNIGDATVLFEFRPSKLSHIFPRAFVRNVCGASDDLPPQRQGALSLDELRSHQRSQSSHT
jgi:hypothetical protein